MIQPMDWQRELLLPCSLEDVERLLDQRLATLGSEVIDVGSASGRALATSASSAYAVPAFNRAAKDGFAVHSTETTRSSDATPVRFRVIGQSLPNRPFTGSALPGQAVAITTGSPMPPELDAVVKLEDVRLDTSTVLVVRPIAAGTNVSPRGEDIAEGGNIAAGWPCLAATGLGCFGIRWRNRGSRNTPAERGTAGHRE